MTRAAQRVGRAVVDYPFQIACVAGLVLISWYLWGTRSEPHHVRAAFANAVSISPGLDVQIDGIDAGKVSKVSYDDGRAIVELGIDDKDWPLPRGTTARLRYGTTLGNGTRRVDLQLGPRNAPKLPEDGIIDIAHTTTPVEFDQIFDTFDKRTRGHMQSLFTGAGEAVAGRANALNGGIAATPAGLDATSGLMRDLASDDVALRALVTNGHRATATLAARANDVRDLMAVMAGTFDTFARNARTMQASLDRFAPTLTDTRQTLGRLDTSVGHLNALVTDARAGAAALRPFAADARPAVDELATTAPRLLATVRTVRSASPDLAALFATGTPFSHDLGKAMGGLAPDLACVRPYAPEIAGFLMNWSGWSKDYDDTSHYARVKANAGATSNTSTPPISTQQFVDTYGKGISYAMPRPPGLNAGKPWFIPECGYGPSSLDPSKDPEDG